MTTIAEKTHKEIQVSRVIYSTKWGNLQTCVAVLDSIAKQKDQNYETETTAWIFEDGSAITLDSNSDWAVINDYGLSPDNEQL